MKFLCKIYYKEKVNSLQELINLSNIYNSNFKQPTTTFEDYTSYILQSESPKRQSSKRQSPKRQSPKRQSAKSESAKRQSSKRQSSKSESAKSESYNENTENIEKFIKNLTHNQYLSLLTNNKFKEGLSNNQKIQITNAYNKYKTHKNSRNIVNIIKKLPQNKLNYVQNFMQTRKSRVSPNYRKLVGVTS